MRRYQIPLAGCVRGGKRGPIIDAAAEGRPLLRREPDLTLAGEVCWADSRVGQIIALGGEGSL